MKLADNIKKLIRDLHVLDVNTSDEMDQRIVHDAMMAQQKLKEISPASNKPGIWRIIMNNKMTKLAVVAVIIVGVLIGINQFGGSIDGSSIAFAQVLDRIQNSNYTFDLIVKPVAKSTSKDLVSINAKGMVVQSGKLRLDWVTGDGEVSVVVDYDTKQFLRLFHKNKLGRISTYTGKAKGDFSLLYSKPVEKLWDLKDGTEELLGEKELNGYTVVGFKVIQHGYEVTIWADSDTGLPLYVSAISEATNNSSVSTKWVMENFDFESKLDEESVSLDGPAEYTIVNQFGKVVRKAMAVHEDKSTNETKTYSENVSWLLIKPLEGIGTVKFGMTREQITEILGEPDQVIGKHCLDYSSTVGLSLLVSSKRGLAAIDCWSKGVRSDEGHLCGADFAGKTLEGIGVNSTENEIVRQYGNKYEENIRKHYSFGLVRSIYYPHLNTIFMLKDNKVIHISINASR